MRTSQPHIFAVGDVNSRSETVHVAIQQGDSSGRKLLLDGRNDTAVVALRIKPEHDKALGAILGRACNHACEQVCTRTHYDRPLAIREMYNRVLEQAGLGGLVRAGN